MAGWIWLIITSILLILSAWILINIRKYCYRKNQFGKGSVKKIASWFDKGYGYVLLLYYILIFAGITTTFYFGLGMEDVFSGLVAGTAITSFIVIELPHLMKPNIVVVSLPAIKETKTYKDEPQTQVKIKLGGEELLFFKLTNAGTNNYLNCTFWFFFPEGIQPIQEPKFYEDLEYKKEFEIQRPKRCVCFLPNKNYQSISRGNYMVFPIWVNVSPDIDNSEKKATIMVSSESRWGTFTGDFPISILRGNGEGERIECQA